MPGPLDHLLTQFSLRAGVFYTGNICGLHDFERDDKRGHLHLIKNGPVQLLEPGKPAMALDRPTLVFLPRPQTHRLLADERAGADVVCATVLLGGGGRNPISDSLPDAVLIELDQMLGIRELLALMFDEALGERTGRQALLDRLCEILMIKMLRHCLDQGFITGGALAGLSDPKLAKALEAMHQQPAHDWDLPALAAIAGMSRARFAEQFRKVVGKPPGDYLASWRIMSAQRLLAQGMPAKTVALDVGYGSSSALHRAFVRKLGASPTDWLRAQSGSQ
ncbi:cupin domain-containing protein [Roseateles sp. GG27B]